MLSTRRLLQILLIIVFISVILLFYNLSNMGDKPVQVSSLTQGESAGPSLEVHELPDHWDAYTIYIAGKPESEMETKVQENMAEALSAMKMSYVKKDIITDEDLADNPILMFCVTSPGKAIDLTVLGNYISNGGRALFGAGIPEGNTDSYLYPIWGITEKGVLTASNEFHMFSDFMPYGEVSFPYSGYNASTSLRLGSSAEIYMEDSNHYPVIYSNTYQRGKVVVINGTLLDNKDSEGILCPALGALTEELIYPVIGAKTVFLEDFPPAYRLDDTISQRYYGRSSESFVRDVIWPVLISLGSNSNIKYTALTTSNPEEEFDKTVINTRLMSYLTNEINHYAGELIYVKEENKENLDYPVITSGLAIQEEGFYKFLTNLSLYGMVSHRMNVKTLLNPQSKEEGWDGIKEDFAALDEAYFSSTSWLKAATYTEARRYQNACEKLELAVDYHQEQLTVTCSQFMKGQEFYLRSQKDIKSISGGRFRRINEVYYIIQADEAKLSIIYEE